MTAERPPRLKDGELGGILRSADAGMSPERLAHNGARIKALIAGGSTFALWKLLLVLGLLGALAVPFALHERGGHDTPPPAAPIATRVTTPPPDAGVTPVADAAAVVAVAPPDAAPAAPVEPVHRRARVAVPRDAGVAAAPPDAPAPEPSELPAEIQLYNSARDAATAGDYATAIGRIDELFQRYPTTPLRADAELTRAELLARANRLPEAIAAFDALSSDDSHRGRRGELLRTLGDLYRRAGDCPHAIDAYTRALAEPLGDRDRVDAERGRDRCTSP